MWQYGVIWVIGDIKSHVMCLNNVTGYSTQNQNSRTNAEFRSYHDGSADMSLRITRHPLPSWHPLTSKMPGAAYFGTFLPLMLLKTKPHIMLKHDENDRPATLTLNIIFRFTKRWRHKLWCSAHMTLRLDQWLASISLCLRVGGEAYTISIPSC